MQKAVRSQHPSENDCFAGDAVEDAEETIIPLSSVPIGGRPLCNFRSAHDIDLLGGSLEETYQLAEKLDKTAASYSMEINSDKSKIVVNSIKPTSMWIDGKLWKKWTSSNTWDPYKPKTEHQ